MVQDHEGDIHQGVSRFQTAGDGGPHLLRPFCVETLDFVCFVALRHGDNIEISRSCLFGGRTRAPGLLRPNDQEYGKAAGVVKFYRDQEKPGRYVSESKDQVRDFGFHA